MKTEYIAETLVDLHNDVKFEKFASFAADGNFTEDELAADIAQLIEKQASAEDSTYADPESRMFSIASPLETKISALYATKCASLLQEDVVNRINDACKIYNIDLEVPVVNKIASIMEDKEIMDAIDTFDREWVDSEAAEPVNKYASADKYGNQLDTCLAARAWYATEPEDKEALENLSKIASKLQPSEMVSLIKEIDSEMGMDSPQMQKLVGSPEYAVYEKVASDNMVSLTSDVAAPLSVISEQAEKIASLGVNIDWDGCDENSLTLQLERLPLEVKEEIALMVGK